MTKAEEISLHFLSYIGQDLTEFYAILERENMFMKNRPCLVILSILTIKNFQNHYYKGVRWAVLDELKGLILKKQRDREEN